MAERLDLVVNDAPSGSMTTEEVVKQLQHALMRRDENDKLRRQAVEDHRETYGFHREWARWSKLVEHWEVELFRREHHDTSRDWIEDFSHENGNYQNECCVCHQTFRGHKRRPACKLCGEPEKSLEKNAECP